MMWCVLCLMWSLPGWAMVHDAFHAVQYNLDVTYDAAARTIRGHVSMNAIWRGPQDMALMDCLVNLFTSLPRYAVV